ncbi:MAG: Stp1/IreP family PP2C-type Ser/Thr phosphatase [Clostridia bacterium]|nr:Stp1/IreP family PP2C-type Ser/Thr phosphatase [Clostridia bacterium]
MNYYGKSDIGKVREENQDSFGITELLPGVYICVVCDGMGGAAGGSIASQIAVEVFTDTVREKLTPEPPATYPDLGDRKVRQALVDAVDAANLAVLNKARERADGSLDGMGTTLTAVLFTETGYAWSANVGDSRVYRVFPNGIRQLTHDHSVVQEYLDKGIISSEDAKSFAMRNVITRAVGVASWVEADVESVDIDPENGMNGSLLLCSDGLYNCVSDERIVALMGSGESIDRRADMLVKTARKNGGPDNITVIIVDL